MAAPTAAAAVAVAADMSLTLAEKLRVLAEKADLMAETAEPEETIQAEQPLCPEMQGCQELLFVA